MTAVTVTATINARCHFWLTPQPIASSSGVTVLDTVYGWNDPNVSFGDGDGTPDLSLPLDDSTTWDIRISFRGAPPVCFDGLNVSGGGDLFELLTAQGWTQ